MNYDTIFYAGIVLPTAVTVTLFVVFLVCWFKFHLKRHILAFAQSKSDHEADRGVLPKHIYVEDQGIIDISETASDSAIDVSLHDDAAGKAESWSPAADGAAAAETVQDGSWANSALNVGGVQASHDRDRSARGSGGVTHAAVQCTGGHELLVSPRSLIQHSRAQGSTASSAVTIADVHAYFEPAAPARLKSGTYPSIETLVEERSAASPSKLYEWSDRMRDFAHAVRAAHGVIYAPVRRPAAHWPAAPTNDMPDQMQDYMPDYMPNHMPNYMPLTKPTVCDRQAGTSDQQAGVPAARSYDCSYGQQLDQTKAGSGGQNDCNRADPRASSGLLQASHPGGGAERHRHRLAHSQATIGQRSTRSWRQRQQRHGSGVVAWTPNIRGDSTSSNNDNYSAMGISRV